MIILSVSLVICSTFLYITEQTESKFEKDIKKWIYTNSSSDPGKESPFQSVPETLWWGIGNYYF